MLMTIKYEITKFNHKIGSKAVNETIIRDPSKLFVELFILVFLKMRHRCVIFSFSVNETFRQSQMTDQLNIDSLSNGKILITFSVDLLCLCCSCVFEVKL